jgi:hypothetical protein
MAADTLKSQSLTNADATPYVPNSAGVGAAGRTVTQDDSCAITAVGIATLASTYKIVRVPTGALIKSVVIATDVSVDSNHLATFDFNWIFSDSTIDGTQAALQGLIPTTANTGATTTIGTYSAPNKMYGSYNQSTAIATPPTEILFAGSRTNYPIPNLTQEPLWQQFGFVDGRGNACDPGGYFDLMAYVSTAATGGAAANIWAKVVYVF